MKKIILILAVVGVLISCSNKNEIMKKEATVEIVVENETIAPKEEVVVEDTKVVLTEIEEITLDEKDYKSVSKPVKKTVRKVKSVSKSIKKEVAIEEKVVPIETSIDEDTDKLIAKTEIQAKVVEEKNQEKESTNNKTIFGALGAILVAGAAVFVFKNK